MPILYKRCKCGTKIRREQKYCNECTKKIARIQNQEYDKNIRNHEYTKFYKSIEWIKTREAVLTGEPLCRECKRPAYIVDHIIEIKDGGDMLSLSNLQPLCYSCHNKKTASEKKKRNNQ